MLLAGIFFAPILIYVVVFGRALGQDENHFAIVRALPEAILNKNTVRIDNETYLAAGSDRFIEEMERQGFIFSEQMGAGYFFKKNGADYISLSRMYSSKFMLFSVPTKI